MQVLGRRRPELPKSRSTAAHDPDEAHSLTSGLSSTCEQEDTGADVEEAPAAVAVTATQTTALQIAVHQPASLQALPQLNAIIQAAWQQRELRRPTALALHAQLSLLLQRCEAAAVAAGEASPLC
jgi:hypothetical protein